MKNYLFLLTIGPVKSFINDSRKSQDLFASSSLLSELCRKAIIIGKEKFEKQVHTFNLITPYIKDFDEFENSIPNRFLAEIEINATDADRILKEIATNIEEELIISFSKISIGDKEIALTDEAKKQLKNHLDIRWVYEDLSNKSNYQESFFEINKNLASIKNYNKLKPLNELGRKCIVDGKLNVKFYRENTGENLLKREDKLYKKLYQEPEEVKIINANSEKEFKIWQIQKGEGISAVTLKKRLHQQTPHEFPSTVHVCLLHIFKELKDEDNFRKFKNKVQGTEKTEKYFLHSNDQLFYKENIEALYTKEGVEGYEDCIKQHEAWSKDLKTPLTKYYALIRFDGDKLGDWFSGEFKSENISFKCYQTKLSKYIIDFADTIKTEISLEKWNGKVIYAGGEDFMAMVNLHQLQDTVRLIRKRFKTLVSDKVQKHNDTDHKKELTLSMGICIAHYKEPLQMVLDKAKKMEKKAKDDGRNRFALRISKHSGGQVTTSSKWQIESNTNVFNRFYKILDTIKTKKISSAFLLNIYNYCEDLNFDDGTKNLILSKKKLFINRALEVKDKKTKEDIFNSIDKALDLFLKNQSVAEFSNLLLSIDFIQRHEYKRGESEKTDL